MSLIEYGQAYGLALEFIEAEQQAIDEARDG
jgi:hypothetical protein